jgi:hypothetical protein
VNLQMTAAADAFALAYSCDIRNARPVQLHVCRG